jgi:hypothetical protein
MNAEARKALRFLASMPAGHTTLARAELKELLMETGGQIQSRGSLFEIMSKHIGAGVYQVRLKLWQP